MFKSKRFLLLSTVGAAALFFATVRTNLGTSVESAYEQMRILVDILDHVQNSYVEKVELKDLIYGAASGIVKTLDPFSQFLPPQALNDMKIETEGEFGGIGIRVHISDEGWLTVITPLPGTPAFRAGIFPHDKIVKIDGNSTEGITIDKAVVRLRGKPGSKVLITIARIEKDKDGKETEITKDIELEREVIKIQTIYSRMIEGADGIGYVRITEFNAQTPRDVHAALSKLSKEGMKALVLDLRFNPGGLLPSAIETVKEFVGDEKLVVYTQGRRAESRVEYRAANHAPFSDLPMSVLINQGSASGSEIVAGALKDHKRASIVGSRSFGKGSVQSVITLADNSGLRLTTAYYYTPSGRLIHKRDFKRKQNQDEDSTEDPTPAPKKDDKKKESEETWGIDPDIAVEVTPETASKVYSSFDLVYFPDNRPSKPIRDEFKKPEKKDEKAAEEALLEKKEENKKDEKKEDEGPLRDEVLERAIAIFIPKHTQKQP